MAYPASTKTLQQWVAEVDRKAAVVQRAAQSAHDKSAAGALTMRDVTDFYDLLAGTVVLFNAAAAVPGIGPYLSAEKQGVVEDPVAEFVTLRNAVTGTQAWLRTNVPQGTFNSAAYKLAVHFPTDASLPSSLLTFTAAQTAGFRTVLTTLIAAVA